MKIARAPLRISFFGGGTDSPEFVARYGAGMVLGSAIDVHVHARDDGETWSEAPQGTGLGSSSALAVAQTALAGVPRSDLAWAAWEAERRTGSLVGWQDAVFAAHGGLHLVQFFGTHNVIHSVSTSRVAELEAHLLLLYSGLQRPSQTCTQRMHASLELRGPALRMMRAQVRQGAELLDGHVGLEAFGGLLYHAWRLKRSLADGISLPEIDAWEELGMRAGAWAMKLLGAGGGGFLLFMVPPENRAAVKAAVGLPELPFRLAAPGCRVVDFTSTTLTIRHLQTIP